MTVHVHAQVMWSLASGANTAKLYLYFSGGANVPMVLDYCGALPASGSVLQSGEAQVKLAAGETMEVRVLQDSGASQDIVYIFDSTNHPTYLDINEVNG